MFQSYSNRSYATIFVNLHRQFKRSNFLHLQQTETNPLGFFKKTNRAALGSKSNFLMAGRAESPSMEVGSLMFVCPE